MRKNSERKAYKSEPRTPRDSNNKGTVLWFPGRDQDQSRSQQKKNLGGSLELRSKEGRKERDDGFDGARHRWPHKRKCLLFSCCNPLDSPVLGLDSVEKGPRTSSSDAEEEAKEAASCSSPKNNNSACNQVVDRDQAEGGRKKKGGRCLRERRTNR